MLNELVQDLMDLPIRHLTFFGTIQCGPAASEGLQDWLDALTGPADLFPLVSNIFDFNIELVLEELSHDVIVRLNGRCPA